MIIVSELTIDECLNKEVMEKHIELLPVDIYQMSEKMVFNEIEDQAQEITDYLLTFFQSNGYDQKIAKYNNRVHEGKISLALKTYFLVKSEVKSYYFWQGDMADPEYKKSLEAEIQDMIGFCQNIKTMEEGKVVRFATEKEVVYDKMCKSSIKGKR